MSTALLSTRIRGIRSYSPYEDKAQSIEFMPLTLIVGSNGTGKTSIIESIKFVLSSEEPPHSDSRRNFVNTSKKDGKPPSNCASIDMKFRSASGEICVARREIIQSSSKSAPPSVNSYYKIGQGSWIDVHRKEDWNRLLPKLFGLPNQAILSNVILCHQEDNLWCMGDSSSVKQIFDKLFGCEPYKKEIRYIDEEIRMSKRELSLNEKDLAHLCEKVERKKEINGQIRNLESDYAKLSGEAHSLDSTFKTLSSERLSLEKRLNDHRKKTREIDKLKVQIGELEERDAFLRRSLQMVSAPTEQHIAPPPPRKKPPPDPTARELEFVIELFDKMYIILQDMPISTKSQDLQKLLRESRMRIEGVLDRFQSKVEEPPTQPTQQDFEAERNSVRDSMQGSILANMEKLELLRATLIKLQEEVQEADELKSIEEQLNKTDKKLGNVREQRAMKLGSQQQIERELHRVKRELDSYVRINIQYAETLGKLVANKIIIADLEKLKECFQYSITTFHDHMIVKINEALRVKWRQVYQGRDIDTIELVDEEITRGKDKKSFNYYMAMKKGGVRMKMREKSSAGQRALASIILRVTLAELFVKDFTFIALDEPTANLDLPNVQALARSIGAHVRKRAKKGGKIQLIIITHDEQFLKALDEESSPFFYRTQLDDEGFSIINKVSYRDILQSQ